MSCWRRPMRREARPRRSTSSSTAAGATANYRRSLLQRALRDIHAVTQHIGAAPLQYESAGRMLLGLPPLNPLILF